MGKKLTIEEIKNRLYEIHGDVVTIDETTYVNTTKTTRFIDKDYGEWYAKPYKIINAKQSHPLRRIGKIKKTLLEKYGVENASQSIEIKNKKKNSSLAKYGVENPLQSEKIKTKIKQTNLKKYGVEYPSQNKNCRLRAAISSNNIKKIKHWYSGELLCCQGTWEEKVVDYLNKNCINYVWQPQTFLMPNKKTYSPDLFLIDKNMWIEIKGYFYDDAFDKWNWFHQNYPNSELWNKKILKEMKIL